MLAGKAGWRTRLQDDLGNRALAVFILVSGFIIDRARQAVQRLLASLRIALEARMHRLPD